ncbi:MAG TPA: hypothetical protein VJ045_01300 [Hyphomicrobiaceae bacterium]|nr:hypothetical protein [Hyphomicrobiaceae bacterium]
MAALMGAVLLGGCATGGQYGTSSLPSGESCGSIKGQLNRLDAKGVPGLVEAQSRGKKLSSAQRADADAYNRLLNEYLGARCHVAG